jgi:non-haem Fe2+, alpha-ketoglutarate-dependent halogenase
VTDQSATFSLSDDELARFHQQGFFGPFTVYGRDEIKQVWRQERIRLLDRSAAVYQEELARSGVTNIANYDRHLDQDFLADHIGRPQIVDRIASILGPDLLCWRSEFFPKYPGDEGTDWHQADTFANASGSPQILWPNDSEFGGTITAWCAFSDVTIETAALQFIPGTHRSMFYDETKRMHYDPSQVNSVQKEGVRRGFFGYDYRELQIDPDWKPAESDAVSMEMVAGQCIIFWSTLMHASHPHMGRTKEMRTAFVSRYVPTMVHVYPGTDAIEEYGGRVSLERYGSVVVSGDNHFDYNRIATHTTRGHPFPAPAGAPASVAPSEVR